MQRDLGILGNKSLNHGWQCIARLGMSSGNRKTAFVGIVMLLGQLLDALYLTQYIAGNFQNFFTGWRDSSQMFTAAGEISLYPARLRVGEFVC